ncbi:MAG: hypothetical protein IKE27_00565 [Oscillospiraceae bacterium]|nr:hypothetical protein [Oscillospiraceae bacterium]
MNEMIIAGLTLGAAVIAVDHLIVSLPQVVAMPLFTAAVILLIAGMLKSKKQ